jgi:hypothetical protein
MDEGHRAVLAGVKPASGKRLAVATACALAAAVFVLIAAVLPAEYGRDPLGTGRALGLLALYEAKPEDAAAPPPPGDAAPGAYKVDSSTLTLGPGAAFEYKYRLAQGASMVYSWRTDATVKFEFHGEPDDRARKVATYEKREGDRASGALTAPFTGIHGWYWDNPTDRTLTISIDSAGFFTAAQELRPRFDPVKHKQRIETIPHELSDPRH